MFSKLFLALQLVAIVSGQKACTPTTPIAKGALGKLFEKPDSCYRPRSKNTVVAWREVLVLEIFKGAPICHRKIFFFYRKPCQVPYIVDIPSITFTGPSYEEAEMKNWCQARQKRTVHWPSWTSRPQFIETVKFMVAEMVKIRNSQCDLRNEPESNLQQRQLANSPIQGIIGYLYSVAYQYGFCID